ncbi:MAG: hypothetical protein UW16_C0021G0003 [Microgenomates group bacterium GW2011_GWC1_44_10]|nr:MAG: hypothetical protein UW16_C0021G0003 [Microgenomates group bacterium GW2011_GWC1_44_10]
MTKVLHEIPYFSQWETKELANDFLNRKITAKDDPKWMDSGADSPEEYEDWSWNICGMACLKMILVKKFGGNYRTVELAKKCESYGGYRQYENKIDGLFYHPFCRFLSSEFKIKTKVYRFFLTLEGIKREVKKERHFIVSVNPAIKCAKNTPKYKGGHLVLITGFDEEKRTLILHNPSGLYGESQENYEISEKDFKKFFAGRGILVY